MPSELKDLITRLPKVELHRHVPGSVRLHTILDLAEKYGFDLPTRDPEKLKPYVQVMPGENTDLATLLQRLDGIMGHCFVNPAVLQRLAFEMAEDAWREGVFYLEVRFSPDYLGSTYQIPIPAVVEAVAAGLRQAQEQYGIRTGILVGMSRHRGLESCMKTAQFVLSADPAWQIVGVDLSGDEANFPVQAYRQAFDLLREAGGLGITIHAGEAAGPESVRDAIDILGANRIGHGVRSIMDPELMERLREERITLEVCPTSNIRSGAIAPLKEHPLKAFMQHGLPATINTDDPAWFDVTLNDEYEIALVQLGLTFDELKAAGLNAAWAAFQPESEREKFAQWVETAFEALRPEFEKVL